ncbi:hypothetical protein ACFQIA_13040 [Halalkalicoccus sp. GCM10025704]
MPETFALGRVVPVPERARIELETLVTRGNVHSRICGWWRPTSRRR